MFFPALHLCIDQEDRWIAQFEAVLDCKLFCAIAGQQHVFTVLEHRPGHSDGILQTFDGENGAGLQSRAIHQDGVHLGFAIAIEVRPNSGVKDGLVFKVDNGLHTGIER